ncbi:M12 family metallopeptidase [Fluviispira vulneris]|uniref:M12 family metallopeptidase n=1 Tax=Fluviispira vulneris TaxID=2763012 RepID=UPI001648EC01|nr:M12 family metallopeptidase [Fluviispira vulneris]
MKISINKYLVSPIIYLSAAIPLLADAKSRSKRSAPTFSEYFWTNGNIPYRIEDYHFTELEMNKIEEQMRYLESIANITFTPVNHNFTGHHITIINGKGCSSSVGMRYPGQAVSLNSQGCLSKGTIQHELLHALGFHHEQNRSDRDAHVKIYRHNVKSNEIYRDNFSKYGEETLRFGEYDINSVMQYHTYSFGKKFYNRNTQQYFILPVLERVNSNEIITRAQELSNGDKEGLIKAYGPAKTEIPKTTVMPNTNNNIVAEKVVVKTNIIEKKNFLNNQNILLYALDSQTYYRLTYIGYNNKPFHTEVVPVDPKFVNSGIYHPIKIKDYEWIVVSAHRTANYIEPNTKYFHMRKSKVPYSCFMTWENKFDKCTRN